MGKKIGELPEALNSDGLHLVAFDQTAKKTYKLSSSKIKTGDAKLVQLEPYGTTEIRVPYMTKFRVILKSTVGSGRDGGRTVLDINLDELHIPEWETPTFPFICFDEYTTDTPSIGHLELFNQYDGTMILVIHQYTLEYSLGIIAVYEL